MTTKFCKDCKYATGISSDFCVHPNNGLNLTNGKPKARFSMVSRSAQYIGCGVDAKWFEEKSVVSKPTFWQIIKILFKP